MQSTKQVITVDGLRQSIQSLQNCHNTSTSLQK